MQQPLRLWKRFFGGVASAATQSPLPYNHPLFASIDKTLAKDWNHMAADMRRAFQLLQKMENHKQVE